MGSLGIMLPELALLAGALVALFADVLFRGRERAAAWIGAIAVSLATVSALGATGSAFGGQFSVDGAAMVARVATSALAAVFLVWLAGSGLRRGRMHVFVSLVLLSALGSSLLTGARDWVVAVLALEAATMPTYVLMGFDRGDDRSLEGALKYFLLSLVSTALLLYGLSFVIGMSGSSLIAETSLQEGAIGVVAGVFIVAGLLAKLSAAPFQWWAPDAYAGAPSAAVAFVSSVPKIGGLLLFARVAGVFAATDEIRFVLIGAAVVSMILGNLAAYPQQDLRRLMAYSGVAHAGYLLAGLSTGSVAGFRAAVFYVVAYAVPSMGIMLVVARVGDRLDDFRGLASRRPPAAWAVTLMLLSLIGIPPLAGFTGKLFLFSAAIGGGLLPLALIAVTMSAVSAGYYLRIVRAMFFEEAVASAPLPERSAVASAVVMVCVTAIVLIGISAAPLLRAIAFSPR